MRVLMVAVLVACSIAKAQERPFYVGGDVSMLPELERAGAVYSDGAKQGDAVEILKAHGANIFRLRVFVNPSRVFNERWGAVQDLASMVEMGKRVKKAGGKLLVSLHYSDSWADPEHQAKPAEWAKLSGSALEKKVGEYTTSVIAAFEAAGVHPDFVGVGNEVASGMLWPDGGIKGTGAEVDREASWNRFVRLLTAGISAVRNAQPTIKVVVHIHGGGDAGLPKWFFAKLGQKGVNFDVIGLSFYPAFGGKMDLLKQNLDELEAQSKHDILIVETGYPWKEVTGLKDRSGLAWPETEAGQAAYWSELKVTLKSARRCIGAIWWYPEARPAGDLHIWRGGAEGLFDSNGRLLRAGQNLDG